MKNWKDMFLIRGPTVEGKFVLCTFVDNNSHIVPLGYYDTYHYAKNRAKFFFKQEMKKIEKALLK